MLRMKSSRTPNFIQRIFFGYRRTKYKTPTKSPRYTARLPVINIAYDEMRIKKKYSSLYPNRFSAIRNDKAGKTSINRYMPKNMGLPMVEDGLVSVVLMN